MTLGQSSIAQLERAFDFKLHASPMIYHNTKLLLRLYRKVYWRLEARLDDLDAECFEAGNTDMKTALNELSGLIDGYDSSRLENRLISLLHSRTIMMLIEKSIMMLKEYPENGELYFRILNMTYLSRFPLDEDSILTELDRSRTTYFKLKKEATETLGVILWGFLIPTYQKDQENRTAMGLTSD